LSGINDSPRLVASGLQQTVKLTDEDETFLVDHGVLVKRSKTNIEKMSPKEFATYKTKLVVSKCLKDMDIVKGNYQNLKSIIILRSFISNFPQQNLSI
jgi:hypothetical protein